MESSLGELLIILLLIAVNGVFSGAEIALVSVRRIRVQQLVEEGRPGAVAVKALRDEPEEFLATVQIGITVVGATAAAFGGASLANRIEPLVGRVQGLAPFAQEIALGVVVAGISYLSIVFGELVPKSLALRAAEAYALFIAQPLRAIAWLARPLVWLLTASSNLVLRPLGDRTTFTEARHSAEELQQLVEEAAQAGTVSPGIGALAARALEFEELIASDVMVPRQQVVMLPRQATHEEIRRILLEHTHNRMPVYEGDVDHVVGYVSVKDLLHVAWEERLFVLDDVLRPAWFVPQSKRAVDLLEEMRARRTPIAIVVDELGGTSGIVTLEDLVEELVGEIFSEHEAPPQSAVIVEPDGSALVRGETPVREVNRALDVELPEDGDWTTIAGLVIARAARIPQKGDVVTLDDGTRLEVVDATARRVRMLRLHRAPPLAPEA